MGKLEVTTWTTDSLHNFPGVTQEGTEILTVAEQEEGGREIDFIAISDSRHTGFREVISASLPGARLELPDGLAEKMIERAKKVNEHSFWGRT